MSVRARAYPGSPALGYVDPIPATLSQILLMAFVFLVATDVLSVPLGGDGASAVRISKLVAYAGIFFLLAIYAPKVTRGALHSWPLLSLLLLCGLSVMWSIDRTETMQRVLALYGCSAAGLLLGQLLSLRGLVVWFGVFGTMVGVTCLVAVAVFPSARGVPPWPDVWRGVFAHKNGMGAAAALLLPFCLHSAIVLRTGFLRTACIGGASLLALLLVISHSRTSQLIGALALLCMGSALVLHRQRMSWALIILILFFFSGFAAFIMFATGASGALFEWWGRDPALSGRIPLWEVLWHWIEKRPLTGYGYAAFWDPESQRFMEITREPSIRFEPFYSHNGFMETVLGIGVIGFVFAVFIVVRAFVHILAIFERRPDAVDLVPVTATLLCFIIANISESPLLKRDDPVWIIFVALIAKISTIAAALETSTGRWSPPTRRN